MNNLTYFNTNENFILEPVPIPISIPIPMQISTSIPTSMSLSSPNQTFGKIIYDKKSNIIINDPILSNLTCKYIFGHPSIDSKFNDLETEIETNPKELIKYDEKIKLDYEKIQILFELLTNINLKFKICLSLNLINDNCNSSLYNIQHYLDEFAMYQHIFDRKNKFTKCNILIEMLKLLHNLIVKLNLLYESIFPIKKIYQHVIICGYLIKSESYLKSCSDVSTFIGNSMLTNITELLAYSLFELNEIMNFGPLNTICAKVMKKIKKNNIEYLDKLIEVKIIKLKKVILNITLYDVDENNECDKISKFSYANFKLYLFRIIGLGLIAYSIQFFILNYPRFIVKIYQK